MKITIETIPHNQQRIPGQVGDWQQLGNETVAIRVSALGNWRYEAAIAAHELIEVLLCINTGVRESDVDTFDMEFADIGGEGEPGDAPSAPYQQMHCFATAVERMLIAALGVKWSSYEQAIEAL
jgi:hypothetical protein